MKISHEETRHIAGLARLQLAPEVTDRMARQLGSILGCMDKLGELDTESVEPTSHVLDVSNVWRPDQTEAMEHDRELMLGQAPQFEEGFFVVPKVLE